MKKWLKISLISLSSLIGLVLITFAIVCYVLFTPSRLTPLVNRFANEFLNADVHIEKVDLSYFSVYPFVRLNIDNVLITVQDNPQDTLTFIPIVKAKLNFNQLVFRNNLILTTLELRGGITNVRFDQEGNMNWDIFLEDDTPPDTTSMMALDSMFNMVDIRQIFINSGYINYRNEQDGQFATIQNANFKLDGSFIEQKLLSGMSLNLKNIDYSDSSNSVQLVSFQTKLEGDLFKSQVDMISDIVMDSLHFKDQTMMVFFPHMTLSLESTSNFKDGKVRMNTVVEQIRFDYENETLLNKPNLKLILAAEYFSENQKISIEKGEFFINEIPFKLSGDIEMRDSMYFPNLAFNLDTTQFSQIHELLPKTYEKMLLEYAKINDGEVFLNGTITGKYSDKSMPNVDMIFGLKNMDMVVNNSKIDTLNLLADVKLRMNNLRNSMLTVKDFYYSGHLGRASAKAVVKGFTDNPHIDTDLHMDLNLRRLYVLLMGRGSGIRTRGTIHADLKANFALADVMDFSLEKLDKIKIDGVIAVDSLLVRNRADSLNLFADLARLRFGSQVDDTTLAQGQALFRASVRLDSLDFSYKNLYTANVGRFSGGYRVEMPNNNNIVNTQTARISFRGLNARMPQERMRISAGRTSANIRIIPNPEKPTSPVGTIRMSLDSLNFRQSGMAVRLNKSQLNLALMPQDPVVRTGTRDTTVGQEERRRGRDTTISQEERRQQQLARLQEMSSDQFIEKLLGYMDVLGDTTVDIAQKFMNEFSYEGSLIFDTFRMRMPDFPLPISVLSTEVHLTPRLLSLNNAKVIMGNTDMVASGSLENFRRALAGRGTLRGHIDLKSNKIDANQLMQAMTYDPALDTNRRQRGGGEGRRQREETENRFERMDRERAEQRGERTERSERSSERTNRAQNREADETLDDPNFMVIPDSVLVAEKAEDNAMFEVEFETTQETSLFMIPKLLSLTLNANIDTLLFGEGVMTNLHGVAEIRDEHLKLNEFTLTNGAGEMELSLAYRAISFNEADVWMDLTIENTDIQNLIELYPEIRNEMPITQSLEGLVDLSLTLTTLLDSAMNVDLNRTIATGHMRGQNLVLLDGETFADIAKMLRFRNRERNLIDSLSVYLTVNNGNIEIFPFKLTMERYMLAVGGTQNVDMSFDYHITVLQAPFRLFSVISWGTALMSSVGMGIDVSGTGIPGDRIRFRPTGARFRDLATPATSVHMTRTINVQQEFRRLLDHELNRIVGQTE
ncbi:MAG: AsmA family protein [Bacteroidales bacterium]|jgi:hypothetical protein|nr:AsmA family protein [Bacteroidales bacterium]